MLYITSPLSCFVASHLLCANMSVKSDSDAPCGHCQVLVHSNDHALECDVCSEWYHISCANVSEECHTLIMDNSGLIWVCPSCRVNIKEAVVSSWKLTAENKSLRREVLEIRQNSSELLHLLEVIASKLPSSFNGCDRDTSTDRISSCPTVLDNALPPGESSVAPLVQISESGSTPSPQVQANKSKRQPQQQKKRPTRDGINDDLPQIRFLRNIPKETSIDEINNTLKVRNLNTANCAIEQTVPQKEFVGTKKFVRVVFWNQAAVDDFVTKLKKVSDLPWQLSRKAPSLKKSRDTPAADRSNLNCNTTVGDTPTCNSPDPAVAQGKHFLGSGPAWPTPLNQMQLPPLPPAWLLPLPPQMMPSPFLVPPPLPLTSAPRLSPHRFLGVVSHSLN